MFWGGGVITQERAHALSSHGAERNEAELIMYADHVVSGRAGTRASLPSLCCWLLGELSHSAASHRQIGQGLYGDSWEGTLGLTATYPRANGGTSQPYTVDLTVSPSGLSFRRKKPHSSGVYISFSYWTPLVSMLWLSRVQIFYLRLNYFGCRRQK